MGFNSGFKGLTEQSITSLPEASILSSCPKF